MSWSRGAWLGFFAALVAMVVLATVRNRRGLVLGAAAFLLLLGGLALGGLSLVPTSILERFSDFVPYLGVTDVRGTEITDANFAVLERLAHWQSALAMWKDNFWFGVGAGNYEVVYPRYALPLWPYSLGHAHNYYLNIAAEAGLVGIVAYVALVVVAFLTCFEALRRTTGWQWGLVLGVMGALVYLSVHSLFDNLHVHAMYLQLAMLLGLVARVRHAEEPVAPSTQTSPYHGGTL